MVRDEEDILPATIVRMLGEVDHILVADNGSRDGTRGILEAFDRVTVIDDPDVAYYQSEKVSRLAQIAADQGADWIIPFDADERWYSPHGRIGDVLAQHPDAAIATAQVYDHVPTAEDPARFTGLDEIGWRRKQPNPLAKVACRARLPVTVEQGNHGAHYPTATVDGLLVVRHFPYRSVEQMIRKARNGAEAYAATSLPDHIGQHWRDYGRLSDEQIADTFRSHFWSPDPGRDRGLIYDPAP